MSKLVREAIATGCSSPLRARLRRALGALGIWLLSASLVSAQTETVTYIHTDLFGSPLAGTGAAGELLWKENYQPYGERWGMGAGAANNVRFHGKPVDQTTGLSEFGARWYDGQLGRFMGVDPAGFSEANLHSFNRYAYGNNNPYKYVDPDGNSPIDVAFLFYDVGNLSVALYRGEGVGEAAVGVGLSMVGVISPLPAVGMALKAERAVRLAGAAQRTEKASELVKGSEAAKGAADAGRAGRQARLRDLANDDKLGSADRGWIKQEMNSIDRGQRSSIRNPPGKDLAHERGREAGKGYDYSHSNLQDRDLHRLQHQYDDFGRANAERPPR